LLAGLCGLLGALPAHGQDAPTAPMAAAPMPGREVAATEADMMEPILVRAERLSLIGSATTASEGIVVDEELELTPAFRPGQLLETVPGLVVTVHSGEGKANQYLMRGYNLDHGTDLATFVDAMPVNEPTHAHGQGYSDLNFLIPELATDVHYTKGTYYADEGDFASVGSVHIGYLDSIESAATATAGTLGFERIFSAGSTPLGAGTLLGAVELQHYDGPWVHPDDQRKVNAVLRYSQGNETDGYTLTGMFYNGLWNSTTDQPERAIEEGPITRLGSLDPSDGGQAQRVNLSGQYFASAGGGQITANAYAFGNHLTLWNDFTHYLVDPVNGDQEAQHEDRIVLGGGLRYALRQPIFGFASELLAGVQLRYDFLQVSRTPTKDREPIPLQDHPLGVDETDKVNLASNAIYAQAITRWNPWLRSVLGLREDYQRGTDAGSNYGGASSALFEPKGSLICTPTGSTELYASVGRGFHSDDIRGVNQARISGVPGAPLIASQMGEEIGLRQALWQNRISLTLALFNLDAQSETTYDPDVGQDTAGPASRRTGYEVNLTWQAQRWLEFYASLSQDRARFKTPFSDGTGHLGEYLPNAPFGTGSLSVYLKNLAHWSGGLEYRYLGAYPLSSDDAVRGSGYGEWNADVRYAFASGWSAALGVYNILNKKANAMEYWYVDRISPTEPAAGVADVHMHPLEPITARLTVTKYF
jgi:outer membrane receptor protein involved in Fe transport